MLNYENSICYNLIGQLGHPCDRRTDIIISRLLNNFMTRFDFDGMPDETMELYGHRNMWELYLFFARAVAWFEHPKLGLIGLPANGQWKFNAVGKPTAWNVFAINGSFNMELTEKNSVLMFNDNAMTIPYLQLMYEARFMEKLDAAMLQNIELQSTPYVIEAFEEQADSASKWSKLLSSFASRIVLRKKRDKDKLNDLRESQVLDTHVDLKINELMKAYQEFLFRAHTYLGIKNVNIEKSERLLTGEVSANDILIQQNYTNALNMRQDAFDEVRKKLGYTITVNPLDLQTMQADLSSAYMAASAGGMQNFGKEGNNGGNSGSAPTSAE